MRNPFLFILILTFLILNFTDKVTGQTLQKTDSLFLSEEPVEMELRVDFTAIQNERDEDPDYHEGELVYHSTEGLEVRLPVDVKARGNFRLDPANCKFPPLYLNFKKSLVKNTLFDGQNKLKLVTPCQYEEYVLEEYIIYKMYNLVTDWSFKVRLIHMLYYDTGRDKKLFTKYGFFIEDEDKVAERNHAEVKDKFHTPFDLNPVNVMRFSVFQYIIGNSDWYITSRQNVVIMQPEDTVKKPEAVPYDFDFSEFIDAGYTKPEGVPDEMLKERRVYKGICFTPDQFNAVFYFYRNLKPQFDHIIDEMKLLPKYIRKNNHNYLDEFYRITSDPNEVKREFLDHCKTYKDYYMFEKK